MIFLIALGIIIVLSIGMAYVSIRKETKKLQHVEEVQKNLSKGKVIFYSPSSKSS